MIKLVKLEEPDSLINNKVKWTNELLAAIESGDKDKIRAKKKKYNQPDVKAQLRAETSDKCAYCESKVTVVAHGDIEHVTPKSIEPELTFEWENLTFACQKCNGKKSDKEGIADPYVDAVDDHFFFVGHLLRGRSDKGRLTVMELQLNRNELIDDRSDQLSAFADALEKIANEANARLKELSLEALRDHVASETTEYTLMKRAMLDLYGDL